LAKSYMQFVESFGGTCFPVARLQLLGHCENEQGMSEITGSSLLGKVGCCGI